jgi:hypothetical protein
LTDSFGVKNGLSEKPWRIEAEPGVREQMCIIKQYVA